MKHIHHQCRGLLLCSLCIAKSFLPTPPPHTTHKPAQQYKCLRGRGGEGTLSYSAFRVFLTKLRSLCVQCVCVLCKVSDKQTWMACRTHSGNVLVREEDFTFPHLDIYSVDFTHLTNQMRCFKTLWYLLYIYILHLERTFGKGRSFGKVTGKRVDELPVCRTQTDPGTNRPKLPFAVRLTNE